MSFNFAPKGWALCNGQTLAINQNQALFALLGTTYGGNGQTTFALPDLRGRVAVSFGNGFNLGERAGEEFHTLITNEMPQHSHPPVTASSTAADLNTPATNTFLGAISNTYTALGNPVAMSGAAVSTAGGSQPHSNQQPYSVLSFCIALQGIFPSQN